MCIAPAIKQNLVANRAMNHRLLSGKPAHAGWVQSASANLMIDRRRIYSAENEAIKMSKQMANANLPITIDPNIVSGTPVFRGTRVPVQTLFDYIADGYTLEEFLDNFPTVKRDDAIQILEAEGKLLNDEFAAWDKLSDEALGEFEKRLTTR